MSEDVEALLEGACEVQQIVLTGHDEPPAVLLVDLTSRPDVAELMAQGPSEGLEAAIAWKVVALTDGRRVARCDISVTAPTPLEVPVVHLVEPEVAEAFAAADAVWLVDAARAEIDAEGSVTAVGEESLRPFALPTEGPPWADIAARARAAQQS